MITYRIVASTTVPATSPLRTSTSLFKSSYLTQTSTYNGPDYLTASSSRTGFESVSFGSLVSASSISTASRTKAYYTVNIGTDPFYPFSRTIEENTSDTYSGNTYESISRIASSSPNYSGSYFAQNRGNGSTSGSTFAKVGLYATASATGSSTASATEYLSIFSSYAVLGPVTVSYYYKTGSTERFEQKARTELTTGVYVASNGLTDNGTTRFTATEFEFRSMVMNSLVPPYRTTVLSSSGQTEGITTSYIYGTFTDATNTQFISDAPTLNTIYEFTPTFPASTYAVAQQTTSTTETDRWYVSARTTSFEASVITAVAGATMLTTVAATTWVTESQVTETAYDWEENTYEYVYGDPLSASTTYSIAYVTNGASATLNTSEVPVYGNVYVLKPNETVYLPTTSGAGVLEQFAESYTALTLTGASVSWVTSSFEFNASSTAPAVSTYTVTKPDLTYSSYGGYITFPPKTITAKTNGIGISEIGFPQATSTAQIYWGGFGFYTTTTYSQAPNVFSANTTVNVPTTTYQVLELPYNTTVSSSGVILTMKLYRGSYSQTNEQIGKNVPTKFYRSTTIAGGASTSESGMGSSETAGYSFYSGAFEFDQITPDPRYNFEYYGAIAIQASTTPVPFYGKHHLPQQMAESAAPSITYVAISADAEVRAPIPFSGAFGYEASGPISFPSVETTAYGGKQYSWAFSGDIISVTERSGTYSASTVASLFGADAVQTHNTVIKQLVVPKNAEKIGLLAAKYATYQGDSMGYVSHNQATIVPVSNQAVYEQFFSNCFVYPYTNWSNRFPFLHTVSQESLSYIQ